MEYDLLVTAWPSKHPKRSKANRKDGLSPTIFHSTELCQVREMLEDISFIKKGHRNVPQENLDEAFDLLDAEVNSLPGGRLGVLFHIRGEHAPPERQEIRLTLAELISRNFLNRELPLPSGTKVDLTLDTSLNLDQLLRDYVEAQESAGSAEVQAPPPD